MNKFVNLFYDLDKKAIKIMKNGLIFSFIVCILSTILLLTYKLINSSPALYYIGLSVFKLGTIFGIEFIICALVSDYLKKSIA